MSIFVNVVDAYRKRITSKQLYCII